METQTHTHAHTQNQLPAVFLPALNAHGIEPDQIRLWARADKMPNGMFVDALLVLTQDALMISWGTEEGSREVRLGAFAVLSKKQKRNEKPGEWREHHFEKFALTDCGELTSVKQITSYTLLLEHNKEEMRLVSYTNLKQTEIGHFVKLFNKLVKGEEWTEEDLKVDANTATCPNCGMPYPDEHRTVCPKCMDKRSIMGRLIGMMSTYKKRIALMLCFLFATSITATLEPYLGGRVLFNEVLATNGRYHGMIIPFVLVMVLVRIIAVCFGIMVGRTGASIGADLIYDLKTRIFSAMQRLSLSFFARQQTGRLMTRVNRDAMRILYFFIDGVPYFIQNAVTILMVFAVMFWMNWKLSILVLIPFPIVIVSFQYLFPLFERIWRKENSHQSRMNALIADSLKGARVLKAFGKEGIANQKFNKLNTGLRGVMMQGGKLDSVAFPLLNVLIGISLLTIWGVGGWQVLQGTMPFGDLISFTGFMGMLYDPLDFMVWIVKWYSDSMTSAQRMFEIIDTPPEVAEARDPVRLDIRGDISVKNLTFAYDVGKNVLTDINLEVKAGQMLGIVGQSGAGKSTLVNLISRLYDPTEGSVWIDGVNLRDAKISDLTSQISVVSQETYIFAGSVAENISYARPSCDRRDIIAASKAAGAHEFIMKLPEGYDTMLGANGRDLSGGERQRVSIARALLQDPKILILDEATSAVDTATERVIQNAIEMLAKGRTTLSIAHRLSTLRNADHLVVLEDGKIVESGTHLELIRKKGTFHKLMQLQAEALKFRGVGDD